MRIGSSLKVFVTLGVVAGAVTLGWNAYASSQVNGYTFRPIKPGIVSFVAVQPGAGYRILVSNSIAQLAELSQDEFGAAGDNPVNSGEDESDIISKKLMPIRDFVGSMAGNQENLTNFVMSLNSLSVNDLPPERVIWKSEEIEKALSGDAKLLTKLQNDLNITVTGDPLDRIDPQALENGIVIDYPVSIAVKVGGERKQFIVRILEAYRPGFVMRVVDRYKDKAVVSPEALKGYYLEEAANLNAGKGVRENLNQTLRSRYGNEKQANLRKGPERALINSSVILNEDFLTEANTKEVVSTNGQRSYDLNLKLTPEGRLRLWKYSRENPGFQLLMIVDGIAIAAPRIGSELATYDVKISQLTDKRLAEDAAVRINQLRNKGK